MPLRVSFHTLGCRLNQLETDAIADAFSRAGAAVMPFDPEHGGGVDIVAINTCTVTGKADRSARRMVRQALAAFPRAVVLVTGCYAQVEGASLSELGDRVLVLPGEDKAALLRLPGRLVEAGALVASPERPEPLRALLARLLDSELSSPASRTQGGRFDYDPRAFAFHSRPALKIQDGCDNDCAYCRVRIARGPSSSLPASEALSRARALEAAGRPEIVLTGVNLSQYRDGGTDFPRLLSMLLSGTERVAFRVSSFEPDGISLPFVEAFSDRRVRPHAHLAVQSGSDSVLEAMGRHYSRGDVLEATRALKAAKDDPLIAADFIVGFPGETDEDFEATLDLAALGGLARIHAFRFSPRPGTRAADMPRPVPERVALARVQALAGLGASASASYLERWRGREVRAVLERDLLATSENYLRLKPRRLPDSARPGQEILCLVEGPLDAGGEGRGEASALYLA